MLSPSGPSGRTGLDRNITERLVKRIFPRNAPLQRCTQILIFIHMALIKDQKSAPEMAWGPRYENFINEKIHFW